MDFDGSVIYIIFAIGYFIYKIFFGGDKKNAPKKTAAPQPQHRPQPRPISEPSQGNQREQTLEDIFETLVSKHKPPVAQAQKPVATELQRAQMVAQKRVPLERERNKLVEQKKHQSHSIGNSKWREPLVPLELVEFEEDAVNQSVSFNFDDLDWPTAVVAKEILDRKFA
jgi:hypothetical protein